MTTAEMLQKPATFQGVKRTLGEHAVDVLVQLAALQAYDNTTATLIAKARTILLLMEID